MARYMRFGEMRGLGLRHLAAREQEPHLPAARGASSTRPSATTSTPFHFRDRLPWPGSARSARPSGARRRCGCSKIAVQQRSTATGPDGGGPWETLRDGDLRGWTRVDALPRDGMQEVWGSNPHSSTGQKQNSNSKAAGTTRWLALTWRKRAERRVGILIILIGHCCSRGTDLSVMCGKRLHWGVVSRLRYA